MLTVLGILAVVLILGIAITYWSRHHESRTRDSLERFECKSGIPAEFRVSKIPHEDG